MKDFFISYNKADSTWAEWIAWVLEEAGYKVVIQAWDFRPGSNFVLEMNEALKEAERVLAVLSPDFIASHFTTPEWAAAFAQDPTGKDRKLVPVRVREADLSGLLGQINYIDFVGSNDEALTRKQLLDGVKVGRGKPNEKPTFPGVPEHTTKRQLRFPGSLPPTWNVPHNQNRNFTGRDELLATLRSQLLAGHHSALTALHGLGGIGKTQAAVEYAYRYAGEYELVWWLRSEDPTTLAGDFALLASKLGLPEAASDQQSAVRAVKDWLSGSRGWLLVFDNAREPADVRPYLPAGTGGHVIITSRSPDWRSVAEPLPVATLSSGDAIAFLEKRSGQHDPDASRDLVEALGRLPLAIEQAAAYIDVHGTPISAYSELFRKHRQGILGRGKPSDYRDTVETTWDLSFTEVRNQSPAGADLLRLCAFLAPDGIPLEIIKEGRNRLPEPLRSVAADELEFADAVSALRRHSLAERTEGLLSVHRLVQAVVRDQMETNERRVWIEAAASLVHDAFPFESDDVATWPACARLLAHATVAAAHCESEEVGWGSAVYLLCQSALYLHGRADFLGAKSLNERALAICESQLGQEHPTIAVISSNLARVLRDVGNLTEARKLFERALEIAERSYRQDDPEIARSVNNLAVVLKDLGDLTEARKHCERALIMDAAVFGPDHPTVAIRLNNLGCLLVTLGELSDARELHQRASHILESSYGPNHPQVAMSITNLAVVLQDLGFPAQARRLFERALKIDEECYGPDHPNVARISYLLGRLLYHLGDRTMARPLFQRALAILNPKLGPDHPTTQSVRDYHQLIDSVES